MKIDVSPQDVFATRIWQFDLSGLSSHFAQWQQEIEAWRQEVPQPLGRSNRLGWNSPLTVFERKSFQPLKGAVSKAFEHAFKEMQPGPNITVAFEAWVNMLDPGAYNTLHLHPNAMLSGCFYLTVPEGSGAIVFRDPRPGVVMAGFPGGGVNCQKDLEIQPKPGQLVVFPHWLEHRVEPNEASSARISVAINALRVPPTPKN